MVIFINKLKLLLLLFTFFILPISSFSLEKPLIESEPEILFQFDKLKKKQENIALKVDFNKAILYLESEEYEKAIVLLKKTATFFVD